MTSESEKQNTEKTDNTNLSTAVLQRISQEHVAVLPRWQFLLAEYGIWVMWVLSVLIGAIAFSVLIFFYMHAGFSFYEATHDNIFDFLLDVLPSAWIIVFVLMAIIAHYNLRHTKMGYKYTLFQVLISSLIFSFIGGVIFHMLGFGFMVDTFVGRQIPIFPSLERVETHMWQKPMQGRMIGTFTGTSTEDGIVLFTDNAGTVWRLNTQELNPLDLQNLYSGDVVHIIGVPSTTTDAYFHGCGVFPWMLNKGVSLEDMREDRAEFLEHMSVHNKKLLEVMMPTGMPALFITKPFCAEHSAVMRVHREMSR